MPLLIAQEFAPFRKQVLQDPFGRGRKLELHENQVPLWMSFLPRNPGSRACLASQPPTEAVFFGAAFDSGNSHNLSLGLRHLGIAERESLPYLDAAHPLKAARVISGEICHVDRLIGDLWVYSNFLKTADGEPLAYNLQLGEQGISSYGNKGPRIPMLGVQTLAYRRIDCLLQYSVWPASPNKSALAQFFAPQ